MRKIVHVAVAMISIACSLPALAQQQFVTPNGPAAGGMVIMCLNAQGKAVPATLTGDCLGSGGGGGGGVTVADGADVAQGARADTAYAGTGSASVVALLKGLYASLSSGLTLSGSVALSAGEQIVGKTGGITANPSSVLTRPADTTAYAANDLVASSTTAGSVVVPSVNAARTTAGSFSVSRLRLLTNKTTGMAAVSVRVRLWTAAPTYTNGDNGAYAAATGAAGYLGSFTGVFEQFGDGAGAMLPIDYGTDASIALASGIAVYWDVQTLTGFTPASGQTFTLSLESKQN